MPDITVGEGDTGFGCDWEVRKRGDGLFVVLGSLGVAFAPAAASRFAEAVARAAMPGQVNGD